MRFAGISLSIGHSLNIANPRNLSGLADLLISSNTGILLAHITKWNVYSMLLEIGSFIERCQQSSGEAYAAFKEVLELLDSDETRRASVKFLHQLTRNFQESQPEDCHFHFLEQNILDQYDQSLTLKLFQFPSTFLPEAWSFTFYEGLIRYPRSEYQSRKVVELGCGIGWITIALACRYGPEKIYGVDINPKAIICARLNLYLNAFDEEGEPIVYFNGISLLDCVEFHESNLLNYFDGQSIELDKIIGCIPQVLNPEPEVMEDLIAETASDEYLYSLSNYFAKQGFIEDQFGLGLIASAVEQSISLIKSHGKLILNLGGRPGRAVLERLMRRRGFKVRRVWQTQVEQAADTEIDALVDIEKTTGHRFEFYMSENSDVSIDARTAAQYAKSGGKIFHSVDVYEAEMVFPEKVKSIFKAIDSVKQDSIRSALDLTFDSFSDAEERYSFLAFLASQLQKITNYPYDETSGLTYFRQQLAEYFRYYLRVDISEEQVLITPGRRELISSLMANFRPQKAIVCKSLNRLIEQQNLSCSEVIEAPEQIEFLTALMQSLKPQLVVTKLDPHELQSSQLVEQLIAMAEKINAILVIDLTDSIDLSSQPQIHGVYRYLSSNHISNNLVLMAALVNNHVYQNYSLNITLTNNEFISKSLIDAAELTYSRTPLLKQLYYAHLLEELLFFQRTRSTSIMSKRAKTIAPALPVSLSNEALDAFNHPAIKGNHLNFNQKTVRLDFGENELAAPQLLNECLFESYLVRKCVADEGNPEQAIFEQLHRRFNLPRHFNSKIVLGNGVAPIYSALLDQCASGGNKIIIPNGSYGYFVAAAKYKDLQVIELETQVSNQFKIDLASLTQVLQDNPGSWLFVNAPVVNPTGAIYTSQELTELLDLATKHQSTVILDSIFSGLEFDPDLNWDFSKSIAEAFNSPQAKLVILGGVSKEYAAGGVRFGYAWSTAQTLMQRLDDSLVHQPHFTLGYAARKLFEAHLQKDSSLLTHLQKQRELLKSRADKLSTLLQSKGWHVIQPEGGLFMVAKPQVLVDSQNLEPVVAGDYVTQKLFELKNVVINNSTWTGLPGYCRFVLSCKQEEFDLALERLESFDLSDI